MSVIALWQDAVRALLARLLGDAVAQLVTCTRLGADGEQPAAPGEEAYDVIAATGASAALRGAHRLLAAQGGSVWFHSQVPPVVPFAELPGGALTGRTDLPHRVALNDTEDGYVGPYRSFADWERRIDALALLGCTEILVPVGLESVYLQMLTAAGYPAEKALAWIPLPGRQPWWLLQNMDGADEWAGGGHGMTVELVQARRDLGAQIIARLHELGVQPLLPGFTGTVPLDLADHVPGAHVVDQGPWNGIAQLDWLDPTTPLFAQMAQEYYRALETHLGTASRFKIDLLHEGGQAGGIDVTAAARAVDAALVAARPEAIWVILGWIDNPSPQILAGMEPARSLILDGVSDRHEGLDRERDWPGMPYSFGSIWSFGGHSGIGAWIGTWLERFPAWRVIAEQACDRSGTDFSCPHESLFLAAPSLQARTASNWQPDRMACDRLALARAVPALLAASDAVRASETYLEDVVDPDIAGIDPQRAPRAEEGPAFVRHTPSVGSGA